MGEIKCFGLGNNQLSSVLFFFDRKRPNLINFEELDKNDEIDEVVKTRETSMALSKNGKVFIWGINLINSKNILKPQSFPYKIGKIISISCSSTHCAIVTLEGKVYSWGGFFSKYTKIREPILHTKFFQKV